MDIKAICERLGLTQGEFARKAGVSKQTLHNWATGKSDPTATALRNISNIFDIAPSYLLNGEGEMISPKSTLADVGISDDFIGVPLFNDVKAAAGGGYYAGHERPSNFLIFRKDWVRKHNLSKDLSVIHVSGDSMAPTFASGDAILVDHDKTSTPEGSIIVVRTEDGVVVKRSGGRVGTQLLLLSDNPAVPPRTIELANDSYAVIGRVVWFGRNI